jgi:hypothetical protein
MDRLHLDWESYDINVANPVVIFRNPRSEHWYIPMVAIKDINSGTELCLFYGPVSWGVAPATVKEAWQRFQRNVDETSASSNAHGKHHGTDIL